MKNPASSATRHVVACASLLLAAGAATAQTNLFSNGSASPGTPALATGATTSSGVAAPIGGVWSECPHLSATEANAIGGFSTHGTGVTGAFRFADDFTISGLSSWRISSVSFYAYQTDAPFNVSPFASLNLRIWSGRPGDAGSTVVFGDTTTNRLVSSTATNIYRVFDTFVAPAQPATTNRLIWQTDASANNTVLNPGTYWLDWQYITTDPANEAFSPPVTIAGSRGPVGANARQFQTAGGTWVNAIDPGKPAAKPDVNQELPFIIRGTVLCAADFNGDGTPNSQDFFDFLTAFFAQLPSADVNHDGQVNSQDFFDFVTAFFAGC